jgi:hypothetical protein
VYDDDFDACRMEECDVSRDTGPHLWVGVVHKRAAVFNHEDRIPKSLDIGECF